LRPTVSQSISKSWCRAPDIYYSLIVMVLFFWGALSDERTGLSFAYAAGPRQSSLSRVRVTVSDLKLPLSSPPTTLRVTVEIFEPASVRCFQVLGTAHTENTVSNSNFIVVEARCLFRGLCLATGLC
jgi:hypothetical protein